MCTELNIFERPHINFLNVATDTARCRCRRRRRCNCQYSSSFSLTCENPLPYFDILFFGTLCVSTMLLLLLYFAVFFPRCSWIVLVNSKV